MFIAYGITRFLMEYVRDDNPFELDGLTISQNIGIAMVVLGVILMAIFKKMKVQVLNIWIIFSWTFTQIYDIIKMEAVGTQYLAPGFIRGFIKKFITRRHEVV